MSTATDRKRLNKGASPTHAVEVHFMSKATATAFGKTVKSGELPGFVTFSADDPVPLTKNRPAKPGTIVYVLVYCHRHGEDVSVYASEQAALDSVYALVVQSWKKDGPGGKMPRARSAAIDAYFEQDWLGTPETYGIEHVRVQG